MMESYTNDTCYQSNLNKKNVLPSIDELKKYYISVARCFNANKLIFPNPSTHYIATIQSKHTYNNVIQKLKDRAMRNPGGASDKTLDHFQIEKHSQEITDFHQ
jgi:hypothetical protein